jgi:Uncharacterized protein conserved in bacteria
MMRILRANGGCADCGESDTMEARNDNGVNAMVGQDDKQARLWATVCHLAALVGYIVPMGHVLGPLVVWLLKRNDSPFVDDQGKEALNFQLSLTIYGMIAALLVFVLIGLPLLLALMVIQVVFVIVAAVKANEGQAYRYPMTIRFFK